MRFAFFIACVLAVGCDAKTTTDNAKGAKAGAEAKAEAAKTPAQPKSDAVITFDRIEDSIPVTDTGVKFNISLKGTKGPVVSSATGSLTAVYEEGGAEQKLLLATETDDGSNWSPEDNPFPGEVGGDWTFGGSVFMDDDKSAQLQKLFADRDKNGLKMMLKVELESSGGAIEPVEHEITLQ